MIQSLPIASQSSYCTDMKKYLMFGNLTYLIPCMVNCYWQRPTSYGSPIVALTKTIPATLMCEFFESVWCLLSSSGLFVDHKMCVYSHCLKVSIKHLGMCLHIHYSLAICHIRPVKFIHTYGSVQDRNNSALAMELLHETIVKSLSYSDPCKHPFEFTDNAKQELLP